MTLIMMMKLTRQRQDQLMIQSRTMISQLEDNQKGDPSTEEHLVEDPRDDPDDDNELPPQIMLIQRWR